MTAFKSAFLVVGLFDLCMCAAVQACGGAANRVDGGLDATNEDAQGDAASNCGAFTCDPTTEYCQSIVYGSNQSPFYCVVADASSQLTCANDGCFSDAGTIPPDCDDAGNLFAACGCYKSPDSGLVTTTFCIP
jgi:hypothetical protein